jgi:exodeoxyribonuclease VII small subunit
MQERTFEQAATRLEEIVRILERGEASLDAALELFEEGTALVKECGQKLDNAEQKIVKLTKGADDAPIESLFSEDV